MPFPALSPSAAARASAFSRSRKSRTSWMPTRAKRANIISSATCCSSPSIRISSPGPILHHSEMMPQFDRLRNKVWQWGQRLQRRCISSASACSRKSSSPIRSPRTRQRRVRRAQNAFFRDTWNELPSRIPSSSINDFSGYTDMAIGAALVFSTSSCRKTSIRRTRRSASRISGGAGT